MHPYNLWSDEDILPTVDPALLPAIEDGFSPFSQPQYIRNCTAAIHAVCYTLTPRLSQFDPYNSILIAKNLGLRLALEYISAETEDEDIPPLPPPMHPLEDLCEFI